MCSIGMDWTDDNFEAIFGRFPGPGIYTVPIPFHGYKKTFIEFPCACGVDTIPGVFAVTKLLIHPGTKIYLSDTSPRSKMRVSSADVLTHTIIPDVVYVDADWYDLEYNRHGAGHRHSCRVLSQSCLESEYSVTRSFWDQDFNYIVGTKAVPDDFSNRPVPCAEGIHIFANNRSPIDYEFN